MKDYKLILISFILLIFMMGAVCAASDENITDDNLCEFNSDKSVISVDDVNSQKNIKEIYVNDTGDDSNNGSSKNPYASIKRALSDVNDSDETTIHLSEGVFYINGSSIKHQVMPNGRVNERNVNALVFEFNHKIFGGNLKIIGAGADKTFVDGLSTFYFADIDVNVNLTLKDITFNNFKNTQGGTIVNIGELNVENCIFNNSYASSSNGGVMYLNGATTRYIDPQTGNTVTVVTEPILRVYNSQFISPYVNGRSSSTGGGALYASRSNVYLENNQFINAEIANGAGAAIYNTNSKIYIINNKFINLTGTYDASIYSNGDCEAIGNEFINCSNPSQTYSIVYLGGYNVFENNSFINSTNSVGNIYTTGNINKLNFEMDKNQIKVGNDEINDGVTIPYIKVTDDNGNIVNIPSTSIIYSIKLVGEKNNYTLSKGVNGNATYLRFNTVPENGIYNLIILYYNNYTTNEYEKSTGVLTTVNVTLSNDPVELYVSPNGDDANNGTMEFPFETIQHAIDVGFEKSFSVMIHLLKGTYFGAGNVELTIADKGYLQIIGEKYGETVIDGNNTGWFVSQTSTSTIENLTFVNGKSSSRNLIIGGILKNCIVENCDVNTYNYNVIYQSVLDNVTYINNRGRITALNSVKNSISNSYFANNVFENLNEGGIILIGNSFYKNATIENCTFINNTATRGIIHANNNLISRNNNFINNKASFAYYERSQDSASYGVVLTSIEGNYIFENNTFENNSAYKCGVIGFLSSSLPTYTPIYNFSDCKFINNSAVEGGVAIIKVGSFNNCEFINNSADYGGVFSLLPYVSDSYELKLNNVKFEGNTAIYKGNDIYLAPKTRNYQGDDYVYALNVNIDYDDLNTSSLVDDIIANVNAPYGAQVGGGTVYFFINDEKVGVSEIVNGIATLNYAGFEDGQYNLTGFMLYQKENSTINNGTLNVSLKDVLKNITYYVSNDGSDEIGNGSESSPFKTISFAVNEASKNCRNIVIKIKKGVYSGDLNTVLVLSSMNNLTLMGEGIENTIIDGENTTYLAKITEGKYKVIFANLTIRNMLPDNRESKTLDAACPITVDEGANLLLDNVEISDCHGGTAIIVSNGNLNIENSVIKRNGFSSEGIISATNVIINNTVLEDCYSQNMFIKADNILINNSEIRNIYLIANSIYAATFDLINQNSYSKSNVTIENTIISNNGSVESLNDLGVTTNGKLINPALNVNGNTFMVNSTMINNFNGTVNIYNAVSILKYPSPFGYTYTVPRNVTVYNSTFVNFTCLWMATTSYVHNFVFDGCLFKDLEYIAWIRTNNGYSNYNITNSVFLNSSPIINQHSFSGMTTPNNINLNDNYWGNNSQPVVNFLLRNGQFKDENYTPDTWIVLFSEDNQTLIKNVTDGENITAYTANAPIKVDYADNEGALDYAVVFDDIGYYLTTDNETNVVLNPENELYPFVAADPMDYRTPSVITITGFAGDLNIVGVLVDPVGNPIANATISSIIDGVNVANVTTDDNGTFTVKGIKNGVLTILFNGTVDYFDSEYNLTFADAGKTTKSFINLDAIESDLAVKGRLVDDEGNPIANAIITYTINGENATNVTTDADGVFQVQAASDAVVDIVFAGSEGADPVNTSLTIKGLATLRSATVIEGNNFTQNAIEYGAGERGGNFTVQLKDANGNVLANKTVLIGYNGKVLERVTNATGHASVQINLRDENRLTFAVAFLGDEDYNATMSVYLITIAKKPVTMTAAAKSFKAAAKSKKYSVTLKTVKGASADGKTYFAAGKVVKLSVNGKTYTAKTNAKGQATFNLKLTKKGKFTAKVSYAGDKTYNAVSKSVKLTIN